MVNTELCYLCVGSCVDSKGNPCTRCDGTGIEKRYITPGIDNGVN